MAGIYLKKNQNVLTQQPFRYLTDKFLEQEQGQPTVGQKMCIIETLVLWSCCIPIIFFILLSHLSLI